MKSHLTLATSAVTFAAIVACSDAGRPVGPSRPATALVQPESAESGELEALDRFALDVSVTGAFTPNGPINVHAVARSVIPTAEAEVTITFPQVEVARLGNWSFSRSPVGQRIEPAARNIASFGANGTTVIDATVSIPVAGYYEAIVSVAKRSGEGDWFDGKPVHDVLRKSVWFVVDPQRGRQTDGFDPASLPETWLATPGPARPKVKTVGQFSASRSENVAGTMSGDGLRQAVYFNEDAGVYQPAANVLVTWQIWDSIDHSHYGGSSMYTDGDGYWTAPCVDYNMYAEGDFEFKNAFVDVLPYAGYGEGEGACTSDFSVFEMPRNQAHVYRNMQAIIPAANAYFSPWTRGSIHVNVGSYSISSYQRGPDELQIASTGANRAIFNGTDGYGGFTQAHEYGHAFHHKALGGIVDNGGGCPSPHFLFGGGTLGCAFREGFADYFSVATYPSGVGGFLSRIETNAEFTGGDGSIVEGAFAAFLLDLSDPVGEAHDAIQVAGGYVAQTVKSCEVDDYSWPFPIRANGPDHFVYCFERVVDTSLWPTYFSTRGGPTQTVSPGTSVPSGWNSSAIRANWLWNMYKQ